MYSQSTMAKCCACDSLQQAFLAEDLGNGLLHVLGEASGNVLRRSAGDVDARLEEDALPLVPKAGLEGFGARNVALRVIADHPDRGDVARGAGLTGLVDGDGGCGLDGVADLSGLVLEELDGGGGLGDGVPGGEGALAELVGEAGGLAADVVEELGARGGVGPEALEGDAEAALSETGDRSLSRPLEIWVTEVKSGLAVLLVTVVLEGGVAVLGGTGGVEDTAGREEKVESDLQIEHPVTGRGPEEDSGNGGVARRLNLGDGRLVLGEVALGADQRSGRSDDARLRAAELEVMVAGYLGERVHAGHVGIQVRRRDNVVEAVGLSDMADLITSASENQDGLVCIKLDKVVVRGVRLDELARVEGVHVETHSKANDVSLFSETTAVRQEDERDVELLEKLQSLLGARKWVLPLDEDPVNVKDKSRGATVLKSLHFAGCIDATHGS